MEAILETERLSLRTPQCSDAEAIAGQIGDWDVAKMLARVPHPYTIQDAERWITGFSSEDRHKKAVAFAVCARHDLVGVVSLDQIREIEGEKIAHLGYWLGCTHWHKGYATEAARAVVRYAFEELSLAGLNSGHFKENHRSGRVLTKLGFRYAGEANRYSLSRKQFMPHVDVVLTRAQWCEYNSRKVA